MSDKPRITDNTAASRYEAHLDGELAGYLTYRPAGEVTELPHTVVQDAFEGRGVGSALARHALDAARSAGKKVKPTCPFVRGWIDKHPDYADLVA